MRGGQVSSEEQERHHLHVVAIKNAVVVDIQALRQLGVGIPLNLQVDQQPGFAAVTQEDFDQAVGVAASEGGIAHHAFQLGVQKCIAAVPGDVGMNARKKERQEVLEILLNRLFPGAIVVGAWA